MDEVKAAPEQDTAIATEESQSYAPTIWNDDKLLQKAFRAAKYLAESDLVPVATYKGKPQNCLIALDLANRMNLAPLLVMQNLYIVKGKPAWSGQFCIAAINGCGRFTPLEFIEAEDGATFARATDTRTGKVCDGTTITWDMVKNEGWLQKDGSKWKTMPQQMFRYRAASFFARAYCPDVLFGIQTVEEVKDVEGYTDETGKKFTVVTLDD